MSYIARMTCLAASRKRGAYCFAGKDIDSGTWVRPVTTHGEHEVSALEGTNTDGDLTKVGDIVQIEYARPDPFHFQHENHLIRAGSRWRKVGAATYPEMEALLDAPAELWDWGYNSRGYGNNRVPEAVANALNRSLWLIRPTNLTVSVGRKGGDYADANKRLVKGHFTYNNVAYTMQITDPAIEARMGAGADRTEAIPRALLSVSLGGTWNGFAYKLIAAIIEPF